MADFSFTMRLVIPSELYVTLWEVSTFAANSKLLRIRHRQYHMEYPHGLDRCLVLSVAIKQAYCRRRYHRHPHSPHCHMDSLPTYTFGSQQFGDITNVR